MKTLITLIVRHIRQNKISIASFVTVGILAATVHLTSFHILWKILQLHYRVAVSIAYVFSVLVHFFANRHFSFRNHSTKITAQLPRYLFMLTINYLVTLAVVSFAVEILQVQPYIGILLAIGCTVNISYILFRFWVFQNV